MKHFIKWIFGFVEVQIIQNNQSNLPIERFLNLCKNRKLQLFRLRKNSIGYCFSMSIRDFFQLKPIESKVHVHPRVIKRRGFPFWMLEWRRKKLYTGGFFLFLLLIWLMGNMIWSIDFEGCSYHTEEALLEFLEENGVYCGVFHQTLDYKRTEDLIRLRYHDISWVSIERVGTRLHIRIKESMPVTSVNKETEAAHVVAEIGGVVRSIITREGTPMVKAGDIVKKGDILISGIIDVKSDFDIPLSTHLVRADGTVIIDGTVPYFSVMELEYEKKNYIGNEQKSWQVTGFGYCFHWTGLKGRQINMAATGMDFVTEKRTFRISDSLHLPFYLTEKTQRYYELVRLRYQPEQAMLIQEKKLKDYLHEIEKKGVVVRENNVKIEVGESLLVAKGDILISQQKQAYQSILENEWRMAEADEYNRENP